MFKTPNWCQRVLENLSKIFDILHLSSITYIYPGNSWNLILEIVLIKKIKPSPPTLYLVPFQGCHWLAYGTRSGGWKSAILMVEKSKKNIILQSKCHSIVQNKWTSLNFVHFCEEELTISMEWENWKAQISFKLHMFPKDMTYCTPQKSILANFFLKQTSTGEKNNFFRGQNRAWWEFVWNPNQLPHQGGHFLWFFEDTKIFCTHKNYFNCDSFHFWGT